ncbi:MAG: DEAD/DEAH box helicase family protein [Anaerolineae bacterium]|nr:DEAD/DEAH box helicase family protein [Gemmatimonadaceae bacterium]
MVQPVALLRAAEVRALIARTWLGDVQEASALGEVSLRPHQLSAIARLRSALLEMGGALLADEAGLGKTYVAAALAREALRPVIVAPAALRPMWTQALRQAGASAELLSYEGLSRQRTSADADSPRYDLVILDEAHHARNPATRRYRRIAELTVDSRVLLLSATPIHNSGKDLRVLLALFLGERAMYLDAEAVARCIVRREHDDVRGSTTLPALGAPQWMIVGDQEDVLRALLALPPPVPPRDAGEGGLLLAWQLVRQWASTQGALLNAIRRRLARGAALIAALEAGLYPSRQELQAWCWDGESVQLAFTELLVSATSPQESMLAAVRNHQRELRSLTDRLTPASNLDHERARLLRAIRAEHPYEKIVVFSQFADSVAALYKVLRSDAGVAALTGSGGIVAGGSLTRREVLERFAPISTGAPPPSAAEQIDFLLTTDLLSEGVNLQDASVVVHLDLPWTAARLEQRVGRSRRIGARHTRTAVYALSPPASAEVWMETIRRLQEKLKAAGVDIGGTNGLLIAPTRPETPPQRSTERLRTLFAQWETQARRSEPGSEHSGPRQSDAGNSGGHIATAMVSARRDGVLALVRVAGRLQIVGGFDVLTQDRNDLAEIAEAAIGMDSPLNAERVESERRRIADWIARTQGTSAAGISASVRRSFRQTAIRRATAALDRAPHHLRPFMAPLSARAKQIAVASYGVGTERVLGELVTASLPDVSWLQAICAFGDSHPSHENVARAHDSPEFIALLILQS